MRPIVKIISISLLLTDMAQLNSIYPIVNPIAPASTDHPEQVFRNVSPTSIFHAIDFIKKSRKKTEGNIQGWITIKKPELIEVITEAYFDSDKKNILRAVSDKPMTVREIFDICNLPTTLGYRKINSLIQSGLLIPVGHIIIQNRKIKKYLAVIENVIIRLDNDTIGVKIKSNR